MSTRFRAYHPKHGYAYEVQKTYDSKPWNNGSTYGSFNDLIEDHDSEGIVVEQSTGLLDCGGREIYEGDILATSNYDPAFDIWSKEEHGLTIVFWSDYCSGFRGTNWDWENEPSEESIYSLSRFVEVVGTIH